MTDTTTVDASYDEPILFRIPAPGPWRALGRCRNAPVDLFFPDRGDDTAQAKRLCALCPVIEECREYAIPWRDLVGIWGGLSAKERRTLRSQRRDALAPADRAPVASASLYEVLEQLTLHPGRWAKVGQYTARGSAHTTASQLRTGRRRCPPGRWEFEGRRLDDGSALWARYVQADDETGVAS